MRSFIWNYTYTQTPEEKGIETAEKTVVNATVDLQNFASPPPKNIFASQPCRAMPVGGTELCLLRNAGIDGLQQQLCATWLAWIGQPPHRVPTEQVGTTK